MRDGVKLSANVFRPVTSARLPAILLRTPYDKGTAMTDNYRAFAEHGYAVVVQDVRGRYASGGKFDPLSQEINDGDDTLNWIAKQAWSDGQVGMLGGSYLGITQWKAALSKNPHLKAIFPYVSGDDDYRDRFYSTGGAMKLGHRLVWLAENMRAPGFEMPDFKKYISLLPVRRADVAATGQKLDIWQTVLNHPTYDAYWKQLSTREHLKDIQVPVYSVGGWYDNYVESDLDAFAALTKRKQPARVLIGPWAHNMLTPFDHVNFGKDSIIPLRTEEFEWFDYWLRGKQPAAKHLPVKIFVMGIDRWREEDSWPPARAKSTKFYLASGGRANTLDGDGELLLRHPATAQSKTDSFTYDPKNPVPTRGGAVCCDQKILPSGPMDQRPVEKRQDVLVYSTPVLSADVEVTGVVRVVLWADSSAVDTDFTAKLVDVFPSGEARNLTDGVIRARYRESLEKPKLLTPSEAVRFVIEVGVTSNVFRAGHRIRLEISSSNFPRFDRNPNTGRAVADETQLQMARQRVWHDRLHRSYLEVPVVGPGGLELTSGAQTRYVAKRALVAETSATPSKASPRGAVAKR